MMCKYCKNNTTVNSTTTHVVNYKDCIIVIKRIVDMAKKLMQEVTVIDYPKVA